MKPALHAPQPLPHFAEKAALSGPRAACRAWAGGGINIHKNLSTHLFLPLDCKLVFLFVHRTAWCRVLGNAPWALGGNKMNNYCFFFFHWVLPVRTWKSLLSVSTNPLAGGDHYASCLLFQKVIFKISDEQRPLPSAWVHAILLLSLQSLPRQWKPRSVWKWRAHIGRVSSALMLSTVKASQSCQRGIDIWSFNSNIVWEHQRSLLRKLKWIC